GSSIFVKLRFRWGTRQLGPLGRERPLTPPSVGPIAGQSDAGACRTTQSTPGDPGAGRSTSQELACHGPFDAAAHNGCCATVRSGVPAWLPEGAGGTIWP